MQDSLERAIAGFVTLGVLRWLTSSSPFAQQHRLGVVSLRGGDGRDGAGRLGVGSGLALEADEVLALRPLDPDLLDRLRHMSDRRDHSYSTLVDDGVLHSGTVCVERALNFDDLDRSERAARIVRRERWFHEAMVSVGSCSLVFVESAAHRGTGFARFTDDDPADRHVHLSEIGGLVARGHSVVALHRTGSSLPVEVQAASTMADVDLEIGVEPLAAVQLPHTTSDHLVLVPHPRHRRDLEDRLGALQLSRWGDEVRLHRWRPMLVV